MTQPLISVGSGAPDLGIDPGTYEAVCVGVKPRTISSEYGENQPMLEWHFNILTADPNSVIPVQGLTSMFSGPKSKTYAFLTALRGKVETGQTFDEADLVGAPCWVKIEPNAKGWMRVVDVIAPPRTAGKPAAPRPAPEPEPAPAAATNVSPIRASTKAPAAAKPAARPTVRQSAEPEGDNGDLPF